MKPAKALENYIVSEIDMDDFAPVCDNIHPIIEDLVTEMEDAEDFREMWKGRLTILQQNERHCLASELNASLMGYLAPDVAQTFSKDLQHILLYAISSAWVIHPIVASKFGEGQ